MHATTHIEVSRQKARIKTIREHYSFAKVDCKSGWQY